MRERSRVNEDVTASFVWKDEANVSFFSRPYPKRFSRDILIDNPHRDFKKRIAAGEVLIGVFSSDHLETDASVGDSVVYTDPLGSYPYRVQQGTGNCVEYYDRDRTLSTALNSYLAGTLVSTAKDSAVIQAHANIQEPEFMALVSAAELNKTIAMLKDPFRSLRDTYSRALKRIRRHNSRYVLTPRELADVTANTWLELRYGWRPAALEAQGILQLLGSQAKKPGRYRSRGHSSTSNSSSGNYVGSMYQANTTWSRETTVEAWSGVLFDFDLSEGMQLQQLAGLYDLPSTAWELTRFSFVFDWVIDVGSWLRAITPTAGVTNRHCWVTTTQVDTVVYHVDTINGNPARGDSYTLPSPHYRIVSRTEKSRTRGTVPTLPPVKLNLDTKKVLDIVSLMWNLAPEINKLRL